MEKILISELLLSISIIAAGPGRPFSASEVHKRGPFWDGNTAAELLKQVGYMPKQYVLCFNISKPLHIFFPLVWLLHKEAEERKRIYGAIPAAVQSGCTKIKYSLAGCRMSRVYWPCDVCFVWSSTFRHTGLHAVQGA